LDRMNAPEPDDATLIARIAGGQTGAIEELYDRYSRLVFSVAWAILGDRTTAEEVTLDVFVQVWQRAGTYHAELGKVRTWLIAITRHHAIDVLRWQKRHPEAGGMIWDEAALRDGFTPSQAEQLTELSAQRERVRWALAQLPAEQREALRLAYFKGYTHAQIAEALAQPLGTVKTRIRLGLQKLRQLLEQD